MFQGGLQSGPFADTKFGRSKARFYFVEDCSERLDLDTATVQGGYERCVGLNVLCLKGYLGKNARQKLQIHGDCSDIFRCFFDRLPEVTELLGAFS